jgi:adenosyl cobinamide kinase/adenosyl cobinamide phosphate guanylyltransferase
VGGELIVLLGGARAGKSALAERLAGDAGAAVTYVATCPRIPGDDDLADRIERHRAERPAAWSTIEEELDLAGAVARCGDGVVVVDCLTTWVGNLVHHGHDDDAVLVACDRALAAVAARSGRTVAVTNEVGMGIVPGDELSRRYRDLLGRVNQRWVAAAEQAVLVVAGRALPLHPIDDLLP